MLVCKSYFTKGDVMQTKQLQHIKRYLLEFGGAMVAYCVILISVVSTRPKGFSVEDGRWLELLPAIPLLLAFWAIIRQYKRMDEFYQRIHAEAFALGCMLLGLFLVIWGFAENAGAPQISTIFYCPVLIALWGLCLPFVIRRY